MSHQRILGLDVGERRIGVALSDSLGLTAQPLTVLERRSQRADVEAIGELASQHAVGLVVVGLPLTLRGEHGVQAERVTAFIETLRRRLPVPVESIDERLSTVEGERTLIALGASRRKRKQVIDRVAAQLILQRFLDGPRHAR